MHFVLKLEALGKTFGPLTAVQDLSLSVEPGEIYGFLGPNGSGKTTTIKMIVGVLVPSSGQIFVGGRDANMDRPATNRQIGYVPDAPAFYDYLSGLESLTFVGEMHGLEPNISLARAKDLLAQFGLTNAKEDYAVNYSTGMKKRLGLAAALIHNPRLLILDEPTNGLDPRASRLVQERLKSFVKDGGTVFLSTHLLEMAERICNRVLVINGGRKLVEGSVEEVNQSLKSAGTLEEVFLALTEPAESVPYSKDS
jgi:ABC-2 type transport system ATP-binding protein